MIGVMYTYPWDLADDGFDAALGRIRDVAGCHEVMLTPVYHASNFLLPHNPIRPVLYSENGATYFQPDLSRYAGTRLKPHVSNDVTGPDYFNRMVDAIGEHGMNFSAWTVYLFQNNLAERYPEFAKHDAFGNAHVGQVSPAPEDVRGYVLALTGEIVERYGPVAARVEALQRQRWTHGLFKNKFAAEISPRCEFLLGLDFNPARIDQADEAGMDGDGFQRDVAEWLRLRLARLPTGEDMLAADALWLQEAFDGRLGRYLEVCREKTTALWLEVASILRQGVVKVQSDLVATPELAPIHDLDPRINDSVDRLSVRLGAAGDDAKRRVRELKGTIAQDGEVLVPVSVGATAGPVAEHVQAAAEAGAGGVLFYNYGLLRLEQLEFIGAAMRSL